MKKSTRLNLILHELLSHPCTQYELGSLSERFEVSKSSLSEDISEISNLLTENQLGFIISSKGKSGGIKYVPGISREETLAFCDKLKGLLQDPERLLGSGFLYTSDIMFNPSLLRPMALIFASKFWDRSADYVVTLETKGVPLATMVSDFLGLPLVVIRREARYSEGSTVSINYFSGPQDSIHKMSISKRAVRPGSQAIIIDDFMRGGGSIVGMRQILAEFNTEVVGVGVVITASCESPRKFSDYYTIINASGLDKNSREPVFSINPELID